MSRVVVSDRNNYNQFVSESRTERCYRITNWIWYSDHITIRKHLKCMWCLWQNMCVWKESLRLKKPVSVKRRLRTTDCGLRIAHCGLQTADRGKCRQGKCRLQGNADYRLQTINCISCCHCHYRELTVNKPVIASVIFRLTEEQETAKRLSLRLAWKTPVLTILRTAVDNTNVNLIHI